MNGPTSKYLPSDFTWRELAMMLNVHTNLTWFMGEGGACVEVLAQASS